VRFLCLTNVFPLPQDRGGAVRVLGLLRALARAHEIHVLALRRADTPDLLVDKLREDLAATTEAFEPRPLRGSLVKRWLVAIRRGMPPWIEAEENEALGRRARELAGRFDAIIVLDDFAGAYLDRIQTVTPLIVDKSNVLGSSAKIEAQAAPGALARLRAPLAIALSRRFERRTIRRADAVVVTSDSEDNRLRKLYGRRADAVVPSAIDLPAETSYRIGSRTIGWLGLLEYGPNARGLVRFVHEAWEPLGHDGYELHVAGAGSPPEALRLERLPGVRLLGYVEQLDEFFGRIAAAVVPLWAGPGVKLKTLMLLGAGIPVAATPIAVEGIAVEDGRHCLVAETPAELAGALRRILTDRALAERLGHEGRRLVAQSYTWEVISPAFVEAVERAAGATQARTR
jgi:glycosyltransferase involved in cell wall biosynthesis